MLKYISLSFTFAIFYILNVNADNNNIINSLVLKLDIKNYDEKILILDQISEIGTTKSLELLKGILEAKVFIKKDDKKIVLVNIIDKKYFISDFFNKEELGEINKRKLKKIKINNKIRNNLTLSISKLQLLKGNKSEKKRALLSVIKSGDETLLKVLNQLHETESDKNLLKYIKISRNSFLAQYGTYNQKIEALNALSGSTNVDVVNIMEKILKNKNLENEIILEAKRSLSKSRQNIKINDLFKTIFFGLSLSSVLLLSAIGLAITFGVVGVINMAHGELIMLGAYSTYVVQQIFPSNISLSLILSIPVAFIFTGLVGVIIERTVVKNLYGRPLETLLATFGISLILQQAVRSIFSPLNKTVYSPEWMTGVTNLSSGLAITNNRLIIIFFTLIVFFVVVLILKRTVFGLEVRAVTQNRKMASSMGINTKRVDMLTFAFGSGVAGIAGVALSQITNVGPNLGQNYIVDSFMVVVFGGVGNLLGTLVGSLGLGLISKFIEPYSGAILSKIFILIFIIIFIQFRPRGLFSIRERSIE